jgi:two-component system nitrogen regulation sensor histidine kinase NtrY
VALPFRGRIFVWLVVVAAIPAAGGVAMALLAPRIAAPIGGVAAWDRAAATWLGAQHALAREPLTPASRAALRHHADELSHSLRLARMSQAVRDDFVPVLAGFAAGLAALIFLGTVRLAGHLSRQLSRPIHELITWTERLTRGEPLPDAPSARGAPEFEVLRSAFRKMAADLAAARAREVEAAQFSAFRELARQVAHELKNPLTPLRFAVARLAQHARPDETELLEIIDGESARIEQMAKDFATLGRLPEGPPAPVDLAELMESLIRGTVPPTVAARVERPPDLPLVSGHYEPLRRAFHNLILNACDACEAAGAGGRAQERTDHAAPPAITVTLRAVGNGQASGVEIVIADTGIGIPAEQLARIFEPYFTTKKHGTGLGLALVRQTIHDHGGSVAVASEPGRGTAFTVKLPLPAGPAVELQREVRAAGAQDGGGGASPLSGTPA